MRYARLQRGACVRFAAGSTVGYTGRGTASTGAVNGLHSPAIEFSVSANSKLSAADTFDVGGTHSIAGTSVPTCCAYGRYGGGQ